MASHNNHMPIKDMIETVTNEQSTCWLC